MWLSRDIMAQIKTLKFYIVGTIYDSVQYADTFEKKPWNVFCTRFSRNFEVLKHR